MTTELPADLSQADAMAARQRHAFLVQQVVSAVDRASDDWLAKAGILPSHNSLTHDVAYDVTREHMLHPDLAWTSVINCLKDFSIEVSHPAVQKMLLDTDLRGTH
jgi:hypothetical protein